jgi:hypothetical protein
MSHQQTAGPIRRADVPIDTSRASFMSYASWRNLNYAKNIVPQRKPKDICKHGWYLSGAPPCFSSSSTASAVFEYPVL